MANYILGISCFYHDSAVALIHNGDIIVAVQEERFSRKKHDSGFPINAVEYCLKSQNIDLRDIKFIIYYEKPLITFERLLETYIGVAPRGARSFITAMVVWLKEKLFLKVQLKKHLRSLQKKIIPNVEPFVPKFLFTEHHQSHAGAAFYPSPFEVFIRTRKTNCTWLERCHSYFWTRNTWIPKRYYLETDWSDRTQTRRLWCV